MATFDWDSNEYQPDVRDNTPVPSGTYRVKCTEAEDKATSTGGEMIAARFQICEGDHKGRLIWHNFNVRNKSPQAERIGRQQVEAWKKAAGKPNAVSTDQLLDVPVSVRVTIETSAQYGDRNRISGFMLDAGNAIGVTDKPATPKAAAPKPASAPKPPMGNQKNPWEND